MQIEYDFVSVIRVIQMNLRTTSEVSYTIVPQY